MSEYSEKLMASIKRPEIRPSQDLWLIVHEHLEDHFSIGLCVAIVRMVASKLITWPEAEWLRSEIDKDQFWASEMEEGSLSYWTPGDIQKRFEYLDMKIIKK